MGIIWQLFDQAFGRKLEIWIMAYQADIDNHSSFSLTRTHARTHTQFGAYLWSILWNDIFDRSRAIDNDIHIFLFEGKSYPQNSPHEVVYVGYFYIDEDYFSLLTFLLAYSVTPASCTPIIIYVVINSAVIILYCDKFQHSSLSK